MSEQRPTHPEIHALTGAYALDALEGAELAAFEAHLAECEACAVEVAELQATAVRMGTTAAESPPPRVRDAVLDAIDEVRQEPPRAPVAGSERPDDAAGREPGAQRALEGPDRMVPARGGWRALAGAAAAAVVVLAVGIAAVVDGLTDRIDELEATVAQAESTSTQLLDVFAAEDVFTRAMDGPGGSHARLIAAPSRGEAVLFARDMPALEADRAYQLWLIEDDQPAPAGLLDLARSERGMQVLTGDLRAADAVAVTEEPAGGSPQPTSDPVMVMSLGEDGA